MTLVLAIQYQPWAVPPKELKVVLEVALWVIGSIGLLKYLYSYFADPKKKYALREQDISYQSGLIFRKTVSQPILRVQHVELKRGPVERKVGLASLQVFSAGGAMHTFEVPGLDYDNAENIRQYILSHKDLNQHG
ncbi:PH domain-containing protein [Thalassomonas sp. M1454]|nr:PH domain-containing protein [Thalassomonas sp. M1454]